MPTKTKPVIKYRKMDLPSFVESLDHGLTADELSKIIGVPARTLYRQAKAGRIPSFHVGFAVRFDPAVIGKWLRAR
jgi:excisionase family DNA binding protein